MPVLAAALAAGHGSEARAQWGYPGGFGMCGWGGWGVDTPEGSLARGMGAYAAGAGFYNKATAIADSINADTIMRFNEYIYESNKEANRRYQARIAGQSAARTPSSTRSSCGCATLPISATSAWETR